MSAAEIPMYNDNKTVIVMIISKGFEAKLERSYILGTVVLLIDDPVATP